MSTLESTISTKPETRSYAIGTGEIDVERLTILNELYNPASLDFMKIEPDMKILTLGCGIGLLEIEMAEKVGAQGKILATDISPIQLEIALKNTEKAQMSNLTFRELDIARLESISERFDRIHCRFVLSHMPWESIEKLLPLLMSRLTSSGALVIEEISDIDSLACEPFSEGYEIWKSYVDLQFAAQGSDRSLGIRLYEYLKDRNYDFSHQTYQPILNRKREKQILALGIRSLAQNLMDKKIASFEQIRQAIEKVKMIENDQAIVPRYCKTAQFFIRPSKLHSLPNDGNDKKNLIDQFFDYLTFLGKSKNKIDSHTLQEFMNPNCIVQSNNIVLSRDISEFIAYIERLQEKYETVTYSKFLEESVICDDKITLHFQVDCVQRNGHLSRLDAIAVITFEKGKITDWTENYKDISPHHAYEEPYFHHPLYPVTAPRTEGYLSVSKTHNLFYATYGNPNGVPVIVLHGGPGEGCCDTLTRFFDLNRYYVIMFDQRGSNRSVPFASMEENSPHHSIADIEALRNLLGIEKWLVYGGSWGSTLAILYGQSHPERCTGFVLRGIFLGREQDYSHLLYGMGALAPKAYEDFLRTIPEEERFDLFSAYYRRIMHNDPNIYMPAARAFIAFDAACLRFLPDASIIETALKDDKSVYGVAKHFFHYSANKFFLEPDQILSSMDIIKHLPAIIVHGKHDIVTLPENAYKLYQKWDNATLWIIPQGGHTSMEPAVASALATALDFFADKLQDPNP